MMMTTKMRMMRTATIQMEEVDVVGQKQEKAFLFECISG